MTGFGMSPRQRLVAHVQDLERLEDVKTRAAADLKERFQVAKADGYDVATLKVVLKLRKMTAEQRRERRALEAIYLAAIGMLEGDPLTDEARRRLDGEPSPPAPDPEEPELPHLDPPSSSSETSVMVDPTSPQLPLRTPAEARAEGEAAAAAGKRVYDNPYPAGDLCRAAWDEGWCAQQKSHGMETPAAYQRRSPKPPETDPPPTDPSHDPDTRGGEQ
jgi:uncharacterized protein (UPF0335 family)